MSVSVCVLCRIDKTQVTGGATTAEKLRGTRFGSQHRGACAPRLARGRAGGGCGRGSPPPAVGVRGVTPGNFLKTQMLNPAFWWLLRSLLGSRGRVYSRKQACQGLNTFQTSNFLAVVRLWLLEPKTNQLEIMKHVNCMQHVILVHNKQRL